MAIPLVATRNFTYRTRRLVAGDPIDARTPLEAKILKEIRKVAKDAPPKRATKAVIPTVDEVLSAEVLEPVAQSPVKVENPVKKAPRKKAAAKK
jgi:hypothetical protein